ncbi:hypothetical protein [Gordonia hydrophobica]|uniref:Uncharacterized protein n=1 Tax=Gordonia hydrophobica TaxID=40516 RepID=A0ABZ2U402_9ACTN|nr:hypothetical protein [Gordonia hydrophobica]MBM7367318.1 hypothetical protein [Gordonia hydrophobica]
MTVYRLDGRVEPPILDHAPWMDDITSASVYDLDSDAAQSRILSADGLLIASSADHVHLAKHRATLTSFVRDGGRVLVNGQVVLPFIDGLATWSKLNYSTAGDLQPHLVTAHPLWDGVDHQDLHYRTGRPGVHDYQTLTSIGVAGFYGRGYHVNLPPDAQVITGIGPLRLPLDYSYRIGLGEVIVHAGRDLDKYADPRYSTGAFGPNIAAWLSGSTNSTTTPDLQGVAR